MSSPDYTRIAVSDAHLADGARLDKALATALPDCSRAALQTLIKNGHVTVDGAVCRRLALRLAAGQQLTVALTELPPPPGDCEAEDLPLDIVHEDDWLLVVNKPANMVMHPGHGNRNGTMQSALLQHYPPAKNLPRGGIVHRLDKDTTGLVAIAKTAAARKKLIAQFQRRDIHRVYLALAHGAPPPTGVVDLPLGRNRRQPTRMAVRADGKESVTRFIVEKQWRNHALLRCFLETGRSHQIRVHLAHSGHPLVGDRVYCRQTGAIALLPRQALHATSLRLAHPADGRDCEWDSPLPQDMRDVIAQLDAAA